MVLPQINLEALTAVGGKPKDYYLIEFFRLYEKHWDTIVANADNSLIIDASTGLLLGVCPSERTRHELWDHYITERDRKPDPTADKVSLRKAGNPLNATILLCGELFTYLNTTMEFTEEAYAGA